MQRFAMRDLVNWKNSESRKPLILMGLGKLEKLG